MSVHDRWSSTSDRPAGKRWEVRYRDSLGVQRKKRFEGKQVAAAFDARQRIEPEVRMAAEGRRLTVDSMMKLWLQTKAALKPKTLEAYRYDVSEVLREFEGRLASSLQPSEIRIWSGRPRGASVRQRSLKALSAAYKLAQADGLLRVSPADGVPVPKAEGEEMRFLSWAELELLVDHAGDQAPMIWLLATAGLRLGEACALQVRDVGERRIRVHRAVAMVEGKPVLGLPKGGKRRDVPVAGFVLAELPIEGRAPDDWLFTAPKGGPLDPHNWRERVFQPMAAAAGFGTLSTPAGSGKRYEGMHPHELRHTAASLAIAEGADVMAVSRMLGHANPAITLRIYSHLWDANLDRVADRLNAARSELSRAH